MRFGPDSERGQAVTITLDGQPVRAHLGETIAGVLLANGQRAVLLIENKIDASLQPAQAERYRQRAGACIVAGDVDTALTLLVAPEKYFGASGDR